MQNLKSLFEIGSASPASVNPDSSSTAVSLSELSRITAPAMAQGSSTSDVVTLSATSVTPSGTAPSAPLESSIPAPPPAEEAPVTLSEVPGPTTADIVSTTPTSAIAAAALDATLVSDTAGTSGLAATIATSAVVSSAFADPNNPDVISAESQAAAGVAMASNVAAQSAAILKQTYSDVSTDTAALGTPVSGAEAESGSLHAESASSGPTNEEQAMERKQEERQTEERQSAEQAEEQRNTEREAAERFQEVTREVRLESQRYEIRQIEAKQLEMGQGSASDADAQKSFQANVVI